MNKIYFVKEQKPIADTIITVGSSGSTDTGKSEGYLSVYGSVPFGSADPVDLNLTGTMQLELANLYEEVLMYPGSEDLIVANAQILIYVDNADIFSSTSKVIVTNLNNNVTKELIYKVSELVNGRIAIIFEYHPLEPTDKDRLFPTDNEKVPIKLEFIL